MCDFKTLKESILDIPQKEYCEDVFTADEKFKKEVIDQILNTINNWKSQINFPFEIKKILAKGSLLSKRYTEISDLDVSIVVDMTEDQINSILDIIPKGLNIEGTQHPLDFYIIKEGEEPSEDNMDNIYDVKNNKWIKRTKDYDNPIPLEYTIQICNFFINGCDVALRNFNDDKILYQYYKSLNPETHEIAEDELQKVLEDKRRDLAADLDALRVALHMISSFRHEAYDKNSSSFKISFEINSLNPHTTLNENFVKLLEKFGVREELRKAVEECERILELKDSSLKEASLKEEVSSGNFSRCVPKKINKNYDIENLSCELSYGENNDKKESLKENKKDSMAAFCFGRYNIPTTGHLRLWETLSKTPADKRFIYTSHTQDKKKNPLDYITKASLVESCIEENNLNVEFVNSEARTFIDVIVDIYKKGFSKIKILAGSDRVEELTSLAKRYNDVPNKEGEFYHFDSVIGVSAGERDPDSEGVEGISGTKMREFVREDDFESFLKYFPLKDKFVAKGIFDQAKSILK